MVLLDANAQSILDGYVDKYVDYRQKDEYGISSFWYWYYQVRCYLYALDQYRAPIGENLVFTMPQWGKIIFSRKIVDGDVLVVVNNFKFNQANFKKWITHKSMRRFPYIEVGDGGFGYKIIEHEDTKKQTIMTPQGKLLARAVFDDVIGFFNHFGYDKEPVAIGFIGDWVYIIPADGNVSLVPSMSKQDFLNMPLPKNETAHRRLKNMISECVKDAINRSVKKVIPTHRSSYGFMKSNTINEPECPIRRTSLFHISRYRQI